MMNELMIERLLEVSIDKGLNGTEMKIMLMLALGKCKARHICDKLRLSTTTIYHWLSTLEIMGLIGKRKDGISNTYFLTI